MATSALSGVNGKILEWARLHYNLSVDEVALSLKVPNETYISWEKGLDYPSYSKLKILSNVFKKPVAIFFFPEPPELEIKADLRSLSESVRNGLSKKVIQSLEKAKLFQENLKEIYKNKECCLSQIEKKDVVSLVKELRELIKFPISVQKDRKDAKTLLEILREKFYDLGIYIFKDSFGDDGVSGLCIYDQNFPVIMLNNKMSFTRQVFTVFHELYHLISKINGIEILNDDFYFELNEQQAKLEKNCDEFASEFLMPTEDFLQEIKGYQIEAKFINRIAELYCVSREAVLYKLFYLDFIDSRQYQEFKNEMGLSSIRQSQQKGSGNFYYTKLSYLGQRYTRAVFDQLYSGKIDKYKASEFLGTKTNSLPTFETMMFRGEK